MLLILLICIGQTLAVDPTFTKATWSGYKVRFNKNYNDREDESRMALFTSRVEEMRKHNRRFEAGLETYEMGLNRFTDMTEEERNKYRNFKPQDDNSVEHEKIFVPKPSLRGKTDQYFNWVDRGAVTEVKQQGSCGSCYTFGSVVALEAQYYMKTGSLVHLSEQNLLDCASNNYGCNGGRSSNCFEYVKEHGIMLDRDYPYIGNISGTCQMKPSPSVFKIKGQAFVKPEDHLIDAVRQVGPVTVALNSTHFFNYHRGILSNPGPCDDTDHIVAIVGFGSDQNGLDYYIVKNSWGTEWGEEGYVRIQRNVNYCSIAEYANIPLV